jgi:hypothetical protein
MRKAQSIRPQDLIIRRRQKQRQKPPAQPFGNQRSAKKPAGDAKAPDDCVMQDIVGYDGERGYETDQANEATAPVLAEKRDEKGWKHKIIPQTFLILRAK